MDHYNSKPNSPIISPHCYSMMISLHVEYPLLSLVNAFFLTSDFSPTKIGFKLLPTTCFGVFVFQLNPSMLDKDLKALLGDLIIFLLQYWERHYEWNSSSISKSVNFCQCPCSPK